MEKTREKSRVEGLLADVEAYIDDWFQAKLPFSSRGGLLWTPSTDVYETESEYRVTMAVPGMRVEDFSVKFDHDILRVRGIRHESCRDKRHYHKMEIPVGPFERFVRLPRPVRAEGIAVTYQDGLLGITLPKSGPERIDVSID
jgi:HSP20 family protein